MHWQAHDPGFVSAIERRYLSEARSFVAEGMAPAAAHGAALSDAIYAADPTNGGLRYRSLDARVRRELETRLRRSLEGAPAAQCERSP